MSELESVHEEVEDEEVHFRADEPRVGSPTPEVRTPEQMPSGSTVSFRKS